MTSHLRSQTNLELPEQVYPAVLLDSVCACMCACPGLCVFRQVIMTDLFVHFMSKPLRLGLFNCLSLAWFHALFFFNLLELPWFRFCPAQLEDPRFVLLSQLHRLLTGTV